MNQFLHSLLARSRELLQRQRFARELDDELRFHLELEIEHNIKRGMTPDAARREALLAFGGVQQFREATRATRGFATLDVIVRDIRLACRRLVRAPLFTVGAVATLAIALGAATGIGALVYGVMLRPLPYAEPGRLVRITVHTPGLGMSTTEHSSGTFVYLAERARSFAVLGGYSENRGITLTDDSPERVAGAIVTPQMLSMLGVQPVVGRLFRDDDALETLVPVLISHDLWTRKFGADSTIVGREIDINRGKRVVLGVLPSDFGFPSRTTALYYPERIEATRAELTARYLSVIGRLAPGVTVQQAQAELDRLAANLRERFPEVAENTLRDSGLRFAVQELRAATIAPVRAELMLLAIMVAALLLIAVANVVTLCLLRAERLRGEVAVSRALGARTSRLVRRFVVEGLVIALASGMLALPLAVIAIEARFGFSDQQIPRLHDVAFTPGIASGLLLLCVIVGVMIGVVSAIRANGDASSISLHANTRTTAGRQWRFVQSGLVTVQIAFALALLLAAGLMGSSLAQLARVDIGFTPDRGTKFSVQLPFRAYSTYQQTAAFHLALQDALRSTPGITDAAVAMQFPATPQQLYVNPLVSATRENGATAQATVTMNTVSADFFRVMNIPLGAGRSFQPGDLVGAPSVVLSRSLARVLFGEDDPIGRTIRFSSPRYPAYRVIGVSGDVYDDRIDATPLRLVYFPLLGDVAPTASDTVRVPEVPAGMHHVVRSDLPVAALVPLMQRAIASIDSRVPAFDIRTLDALVGDITARLRLTMLLLAIAAAATLLLSAVGLYSVIAYAVAGRGREFAVRLALGATPRGVMHLVFRDGVRIAVAGLAAGVVLSFAGAQLLRGLLFDVRVTDPAVYGVGVLVVLVTTAAATYVPARRAGKGDPARVLRGE